MLTLGCDIGTRFVKACLADNTDLLGFEKSPVAGDMRTAMDLSIESVLEKTGTSRRKIKAIAATGHGRGQFQRADMMISEEYSSALGVYHLNKDVKILVDGGGLFMTAVTVGDLGRPLDFQKNEMCASCAGRFLETVVRMSGFSFEEIDCFTFTDGDAISFSSSCSVFAESEIISRFNEGVSPERILAGVITVIALKLKSLLRTVYKDEGPIALAGGLGTIGAVRKSFENQLGRPLAKIPADPMSVNAYGAAMYAQQKLRRTR